MSARFYIGQSPGGHALRVMKNAADNPATTPRSQYDKFAFDSESGNLAYAYALGSSPNINGLSYMPMVSSMVRYEANWWDIYGSTEIRQRNNYAAIETTDGARVTKVKSSGSQHVWFGEPAAQSVVMPDRPTPTETRTLVWQLPTDNSPSPFPSGIGAMSRFYKSGGQVRLPRPGYSVDDPNINNYIIHENLSPAKIIRSGRITIPAGGDPVEVSIPPEVGDNLFVGGVVGMPGSPVQIPFAVTGYNSGDYRRVQVRFMGNGVVRFREREGKAAYVAYYIVAEDGLGHSSGSASFLRSFGAGSNAYVQMRRPGCAEPPNLSDIILDSRWSAMPIVASGYVPKSSFSTSGWRVASRTFPDLGYIPLAIVSWHFDYGTEFRSTQGISGYFFAFDPAFPAQFYQTGTTRYAQITSNDITFRHAMGYLNWGQASNNGMQYDTVYFNNAFRGVQYYIFAIPQS